MGYNLYELTSSSLSADFDHIAYYMDVVADELILSETYNKKSDRYFLKNYGIVNIDIDENDFT